DGRDQASHRLHVAEVFALRRVDGAREPDVLWPALRLARRGAGETARRTDRADASRTVSGAAGGVALRRLAATAGDGVFARPQAQRVVPRRADGGDRSGGAARVVGFAVRVFEPGYHAVRDDALHGRGGAVFARGLHSHV